MGLSLLLPVIGLIFTVVSELLLLYSTIDKTSTLKMKSFSTVRVAQRGSQRYMEKRRGRRDQGASQGASEKSGILWSWDASLGTPLGFEQWKRSFPSFGWKIPQLTAVPLRVVPSPM